ncbi:fhkE [Symbiodinium necroappetens]|uniref:FhkE protein n=1 Tax=Symbiodinium necroappetens TaxID=1628268 RepID=A0A812JWS0_9DINO|nr:fhkE [Symbiodinium necroappetens]
MAAHGAGYEPGPGPPCSVMPEKQLTAWLEKLKLTSYAAKASSWCQTMGAVSVHEILENWEDFAEACSFKPLERRRVEKDAANVVGNNAATGNAAAAASEAAAKSRPPTPSGAAAVTSAATAANNFGPKEDPEKYVMGEELGSGATATVCRCVRKKDSKQFAVKSINIGKLRLQPNFQKVSEKLQREVSILSSLRHNRIVSLFESIESQDYLHLVMELVEGGELFDHIVNIGSFTEPVARYVFIQIAEGLKYIHSQHIVYRDLKPENILVDQKNSRQGLLEIKLSDFGHSKLIHDGYSTALTRVGTPQYWAPEVSDPFKAAKGYDERVDLWSLGVVLYVMLVGAYPFDGLGEPIDAQIRRASVQFPAGRRPSQNAQDLIRALIQSDPMQRLDLDRCLAHPWVSTSAGSLSKVLNEVRQAPPEEREEPFQLPGDPSKEQIDGLRRDLQHWIYKWRCGATIQKRKQGSVEATYVMANMQLGVTEDERRKARRELQDLINFNFPGQHVSGGSPGAPSTLPSLPEERMKKSHRLLTHTLKVTAKDGAGVELEPEAGGMKVMKVFPKPGQPGLEAKDLIINIDGMPLRGTPETVEDIFGQHFRDGVQLTIKRFQR